MTSPLLHPLPEHLVEERLAENLEEVEKALDADGLTFAGPITYGVDDLIRETIEDVTPKKARLVVILETTGGYIEVAQRIADTFRHHYGQVEFVVPNFAMSAGTVLVMSGDAIYMDYYSVLGPIDPQVQRRGTNAMVPALGYLAKYKELIDKAACGALSSAEITYLVERFDPAELYAYEQARELSTSLLKEWLATYKFKNWTHTRSRGLPVTDDMRRQRAEEIASKLNNSDHWHSHSRGISMAVLKADLNLEIEDFGANPDLGGRIRAYYKLLRRYMGRRGHLGVIHRRNNYVPLGED